MKSIWTQTTKIPGRNPLPGNKKTEVAVIGAGLFGILAAHYLKEQGKEVIVLEANRIGSGQSGYTTAKITSQHNLIYQKLVNTMGEKHAAAYAMANQQAIRDYEKLIDRYRIACRFEKKDAYLFSVNESEILRQEAYRLPLSGRQSFRFLFTGRCVLQIRHNFTRWSSSKRSPGI